MARRIESRKTAKKKPLWVRRLKQGLAFATIIFLTAFAGVFVMFLLKLRDAEESLQTPEFQARMDAVSRGPTRILTRDAVELYRVSAEYRLPVKDLEDIPEHVRQAMLAAEDKRFYTHPGVDSTGLLRAFASIFKDGRVSQGGSTLTMQLAKLLYNGNERSLKRKISDIAYAYAIEKYKTKDQILLLYMNKVFFGENAHGIRAAAKVYFNKDLKDLTVGEAAMLARSVQRPSQYNPIKNYEESLRDRDSVLAVMKAEGWINESTYQKGINETPRINKNPPRTTARRADFGQYFVQHVLTTLKEDLPDIDVEAGGYTVYVTIDSRLQKHAEEVVRDRIRANRGHKVNQGAFVAMNRDGQILCEVGGVDFQKNQYNIVTQGRRQPGSAFKAFVYATAFQTGSLFGPDDSVSNAVISRYDPGSRKTWTPRNSGSWETASSYSARTAFAASINRCAIHLIDEIGPSNVVQVAKDSFGIDSELFPGSTLALGASAVRPLEMLEAYGVFMGGGDRVRPYPITKIITSEGELVRQYQPQRFVGAFSAPAVANMDELMRAVVTSGTARVASSVPNAKGKTGTTNSHLDAWFCGYTDGLVGIGWVGNQQVEKGVAVQKPMSSSTYGGTVTALIWADIMKVAHERFATEDKASASSAMASAIPPVQPRTRSVRESDEPDVSPTIADPEPENPPEDELTPPTLTPPDPDRAEEQRREAERREAERREADRRAETEREREIERIVEAERQRERDRQREADRRRREQNVVVVDVCADTGMVANPYCPETVSRTFERGRAPSRRCRVHGPG